MIFHPLVIAAPRPSLSDDPPPIFLLQARGVTAVFLAMQRLVGEATLQVKGTDMLQTLINEERQVRNM